MLWFFIYMKTKQANLSIAIEARYKDEVGTLTAKGHKGSFHRDGNALYSILCWKWLYCQNSPNTRSVHFTVCNIYLNFSFKWHHEYTISKIYKVGNCTGQVTRFFHKKTKKGRSDLQVKRDFRQIPTRYNMCMNLVWIMIQANQPLKKKIRKLGKLEQWRY